MRWRIYLEAEARRTSRQFDSFMINIHLDGGPPHLDTIDMKMSAPSEIRGEVLYSKTCCRIPGLADCCPKIASMDQLTFIRSLTGSAKMATTFSVPVRFQQGKDLKSINGGRPAFGSVISKLQN